MTSEERMTQGLERKARRLERKVRNLEATAANQREKSILRSKKFWAALLAALAPVANNMLALGLNPTELASAVAPLLVYVVGQGLADVGKNKEKS